MSLRSSDPPANLAIVTPPPRGDTHVAHGCDCAAHRHVNTRALARSGSFWASVAPVAACAFCPACFSVWAPGLALLGVSAVVAESLHHAALAIGVVFAGGATARRALRNKSWNALVIVALSVVAVIAGHVLGSRTPIEILGALGLMLAAIVERRAVRARALAGGSS